MRSAVDPYRSVAKTWTIHRPEAVRGQWRHGARDAVLRRPLERLVRVFGVQPERAADVLPRRAVRDCRACEPAGDLVELVDRRTDFGQCRECLVGLGGLERDASDLAGCASLNFALNELAEVARDRNALRKGCLPKRHPRLGRHGNPSELVGAWHGYNATRCTLCKCVPGYVTLALRMR